MSNRVQVIAEFLPKKNYEEKLFRLLNELGKKTLKNEKGCLRYLVTRQVFHPNASGVSKYKMASIEEFTNKEAFELHCQANYVTDFIKNYVENTDTSILEDFCVRLFSTELEE